MPALQIKTVISFPDGTETHRQDAIDTGVLAKAGDQMFMVQTVMDNVGRSLLKDQKLLTQLSTLKAVQ